MLVARRAGILKYIQSKGEISTGELFDLFPGFTPKTIRRDLAFLERAGAILRSHGRARVNRQYLLQPESHYSERESENMPEKYAIAELASGLLDGRRSIFLDSGTTMMALAHCLPDANLSILTAAPNIALYIAAQKPTCSVLLTGGNLNPKTLSCSGYGSIEQLGFINIDLAFMAASGFSQANGFTVGEQFECELKRAVVAKAGRVVMLMDSSKIGLSMPFTFARPPDIDTLIGDARLDGDNERFLTQKGVRVLKAERNIGDL